VYALASKSIGIFYVGLTTDLPQRYKQHLAGDGNDEKTRLIRVLQADEEEIEVIRLDVGVGMEEGRQLESFWILYYTLARASLTNTSPGALLEMCWIDQAHRERLKAVIRKW